MTTLIITTGEDVDLKYNATSIIVSDFNPVSFHWQKDGVNLSSGSKYKGTRSDTLTILNTHKRDKGTYTLTVYFGSMNASLFIMYLYTGKPVMNDIHLDKMAWLDCSLPTLRERERRGERESEGERERERMTEGEREVEKWESERDMVYYKV